MEKAIAQLLDALRKLLELRGIEKLNPSETALTLASIRKP